jgi:eukaryotic-like serine/threonine-protein kinase
MAARGTAASSFAGGRYTVERVLGRGGMSTVYLARDTALDRSVALKVLAESYAGDTDFSRRFRREAQTAARLSHPNVVQVYDTGEEGGRLFIVMEYVDGEDLNVARGRQGRFAPAEVVEAGVQACAALGYAHEHGVVHRDVKPANLLVRSDGLLKVTDFGIARAVDAATQLTRTGTILGTASYVAPEQAHGEPVGPAADLFALGVVLYELATGTLPWRVESLAQLASLAETPPPRLRSRAPDAPPELEDAVMRCLSRDPFERPASAQELASALQGGRARTAATVALAARTEATVPLRGPAPPPRAGDRAIRPAFRPRRLAPLLAAVLVVLAGIALAVVLASRGGDEPERTRVPARVDPVPRSDDPAEQARDLEEWLRDHTAGGG